MSYQLTIYNFALELLNFFFGVDNKSYLNRLYVMLFSFFLIQLPLSTLKNISKLQYASIIGTVALIYSIFVVVIEMFFYYPQYFKNHPTEKIEFFQPVGLGYVSSFGVFMFGFANHNGVLQVFNELKNPTERRCKKALIGSFILEIFLYILISFGGFFSTFNETKGIFLDRDDLEGHKDIPIKIAKITLFICLHCIMAINFNILRCSLKTIISSAGQLSFGVDLLLAFIVYALCNVVVFFRQDVVDILGFVGGFSTVAISFFIPITVYYKTSGKPIKHPKILIGLIIIFIVGILGIGSTLYSLYNFLNPEKKVT